MHVNFARTAKVGVFSTKMPFDSARLCSNNFAIFEPNRAAAMRRSNDPVEIGSLDLLFVSFARVYDSRRQVRGMAERRVNAYRPWKHPLLTNDDRPFSGGDR